LNILGLRVLELRGFRVLGGLESEGIGFQGFGMLRFFGGVAGFRVLV
jgi:hypothetical protein